MPMINGMDQIRWIVSVDKLVIPGRHPTVQYGELGKPFTVFGDVDISVCLAFRTVWHEL